VADAGAGRHDAEIVEGALPPFQKTITLTVALIFELDVLLEGFRRAEFIDDDGMINDEIDRHQRVDLLRVSAELRHRVPHRGKIDDGGNAGEILHQHARGTESDLLVCGTAVLKPGRHGHDVALGNGAPVFEAQQILEQHLHRERQARNALKPVLLGGFQRVVMVLPCTDHELLAAFEAVERWHRVCPERCVGVVAGL
jgi:hypothetical protein